MATREQRLADLRSYLQRLEVTLASLEERREAILREPKLSVDDAGHVLVVASHQTLAAFHPLERRDRHARPLCELALLHGATPAIQYAGTCAAAAYGRSFPRSGTSGVPISWTGVAIASARNRIERLVNRLKQYRRIATRYEKSVASYAAFVTLAALRIWL